MPAASCQYVFICRKDMTQNQTFAFYFLLPSLYYSGLTDAMLIQKINRHDCHEEFAYEDNGDWKAAATQLLLLMEESRKCSSILYIG